MNRIDKVVVFHPLERDELQSVLDIELGMVQKRVLGHRHRTNFCSALPTPAANSFFRKAPTSATARVISNAPSSDSSCTR